MEKTKPANINPPLRNGRVKFNQFTEKEKVIFWDSLKNLGNEDYGKHYDADL